MWVPVETARRTVRSGRSPYTSRLEATVCQSSVSLSMTAGDGSRATNAPLRAPTEVPSTRSGVDASLEERLQHPHLGGTQHPTSAEHERGGHRLGLQAMRITARGARRASARPRDARPRR